METIKLRTVKETQYYTYAQRMASFEHWPKLNPTPHQLASVGFFYLGRLDFVSCFDCGCSLKDWEPDEDPVTAHLNHNPDCYHLTSVLNMETKTSVPEILVAESQVINSTALWNFNTFSTTNHDSKKRRKILPEVSSNQTLNLEKLLEENANPKDRVMSMEKETLKINLAESVQLRLAEKRNLELKTKLTVLENKLEQRVCKVCLVSESNVFFMPCGHLATCVDCGMQLTACAVCRSPITSKIKIFAI